MLRDLLAKLVKYFPSQALPAISGFITLPIITHLFAPEIFGKYVIALALVDFLVAGTCSGIGSGVIRFYGDYKSRSELGRFFAAINANLLLMVGGTFVLVSAALLVARGRLDRTTYQLLQLAVVAYLLRGFSGVYLGVPRAAESAGLYTTFSLLLRYGSLAIGLSLIIGLGMNIGGLIWGDIGASLLVLPVLVYVSVRGVRMSFRDFSFEEARVIFRWAWPLLIGNVAMWGLNLSDRYIVSLFRPPSELGFYSLAYGISDKSMAILVTIFILTVSPSVINAWKSSGRLKAEETLTVITRIYLITALPAAVGLTALGLPIIKVLATPAYYEGSRAIGYVAFSSFFWGLSIFATVGLIIAKRTRQVSIDQVIAAATNIGLNFLLVPRFGFVAAAMTTLIGFALLFVLLAYHAHRDLTWRVPVATIVRTLVSSGTMLAFLLVLRSAWPSSPVGVLGVGTLGGAGIHFGILALLGEFRKTPVAVVGEA